jgi:hypothetical protein
MKMFICAVFFVVAFVGNTVAAEKINCDDPQERMYATDFCQAVRVSHEALELNKKVLEKSEEIRKMIEQQLKQNFDSRR